MSRWALYPTEIEADLLPGIDIHDWHRGARDDYGALKLSSRRLLILIAALPENGRYKTLRRGGYLSEDEIVPREIYNEIAKLRASYYAINGGQESVYEPFEFVDPMVRVDRVLEDISEDEEAEESSEVLYGEMGLF
jgi:hypothetical protein